MHFQGLLKLHKPSSIIRPIQLESFNDLSKSLFISFYYFFSKSSDLDCELIRKHIADAFGAQILRYHMTRIAGSIGAKILGSSEENFAPHGASALMLLADSNEDHYFHLDKSHMSAHTYPDSQYSDDMAILRVDFELSTCGEINPLKSVQDLLAAMNPDLVSLDFVVKGMTRKFHGAKQYLATSCDISNEFFIDVATNGRYEVTDESIPQHRFWKFHLERKEKSKLYQYSSFGKTKTSSQFAAAVSQEIHEIKACRPQRWF